MNTSQLQCVIDCDPVMRKRVLGVYALDRLPRGNRELPYDLIANIQLQIKNGLHWVAMYLTKDGCEFFDSYGHKPDYFSPIFLKYLSKNASSIKYNDKKNPKLFFRRLR